MVDPIVSIVNTIRLVAFFYQQFKYFLEDVEIENEDRNLRHQYVVIETVQSDKMSLDIAEWNPHISGHEGDILWFCYKNRMWGVEIWNDGAADVFEK